MKFINQNGIYLFFVALLIFVILFITTIGPRIDKKIKKQNKVLKSFYNLKNQNIKKINISMMLFETNKKYRIIIINKKIIKKFTNSLSTCKKQGTTFSYRELDEYIITSFYGNNKYSFLFRKSYFQNKKNNTYNWVSIFNKNYLDNYNFLKDTHFIELDRIRCNALFDFMRIYIDSEVKKSSNKYILIIN